MITAKSKQCILKKIEIMIYDGADEVIRELFKSLKNRYQNNLNL